MIKDILLAEVNDSRLIEATIAALEHGSQEFAQVSDTPGYLRATPEVSVVLTHYNYSAFVREAIESVVASTGVRLELVVVDNHSDPEELDHLRSVIDDYEWFPIRLVANAADQGPSASRNIGARHARAALLLLLDADNMLYPTGAQLLHAALAQSDAAFAYGLIEKFGEDTGLLSAVPWNIEQLVHSNYIDTMALIRRRGMGRVRRLRPPGRRHGRLRRLRLLAAAGGGGLSGGARVVVHRALPRARHLATVAAEPRTRRSSCSSTGTGIPPFPGPPWRVPDDHRIGPPHLGPANSAGEVLRLRQQLTAREEVISQLNRRLIGTAGHRLSGGARARSGRARRGDRQRPCPGGRAARHPSGRGPTENGDCRTAASAGGL